MQIIDTPFAGLKELKPRIFADSRGYFFESWNQDTFRQLGLQLEFKQDNQSLSHKGVLRGMHLQLPPWQQGKLVRVICGAVLDVVVDLRKDQPTYGQHFKKILSPQDNHMLWIPPGFAHGFLALEDNTIFSYKCTGLYHKEAEVSLAWNDPDLAIDWGVDFPVISEKDRASHQFRDFISPF